MFKTIFAVGILGVAGAAGYQLAIGYQDRRNQITWETAEIESDDITRSVTSTGTIEPALSVSIGTFVSGPIAGDLTSGDVLITGQEE
ncbi:hypothetical protein Enr13x_44290 [Stieleria neptunia]|uniref:Uncharacterized protein n=2 Tax=Stieleria neptunia TaxID=2527979 RepID=A0A518HUT7_9BACT|nr:hypothetical protein Enr13x_44290 [Stieleria neptunia]